MYELYDILITSYEDLFASQFVFINTNSTTQLFPLPDGATNYFGGTYPSTGITAPAQALYKLAGMDLGVNTSNNAWVTLLKFDFIERNKYVYPNSTSTIYGVYPIVRAAKYALDKEEGSDTSKLDAEIAFLKTRIEQAAQNRDAGIADTISNTRQDPLYGGTGFAGGGGAQGGWAIAALGLLPCLVQHNVGYGSLIDPVLVSQFLLATLAGLIGLAYFFYFRPANLSSGVLIAGICRTRSGRLSAFADHIRRIVRWSAKK